MSAHCGGCGDPIGPHDPATVHVGHGLGRLCALCAPVADEAMEINLFETEVAIARVDAVTALVRSVWGLS